MRSASDATITDNATAVILAGGQSRRMGQDKARLIIEGEPLIARVHRLLRVACSNVVIVGGDYSDVLPGTPVIPDLRPGQGPLAALESALAATTTPLLFVVACDMPFVSPALARHMLQRAIVTPTVDVVALRTAHGLEPLHAVYRRRCQPVATALLDAGERSLRALLTRSPVLEINPDEAADFDPHALATYNANTLEEWRDVLARAERWRP